MNQFEALCGKRDWFGGGSILILTTRDAHVLKELKKDEHYESEALTHEQSLQLFSLHAFKGRLVPKEDYDAEVLDGIVAYCEGLPLALKVLGAYLYDKPKEIWTSAFEKLKRIPNKNVQDRLKISYDGLPDDDIKSLFLDLVWFSNGVSKEIIDSMGYFSPIEIRDLVDNCLINCQGSWISMHSLIRDMGREIIHSESPKNPGQRSRLWCRNDIDDVLTGRQKGTKKIEMIVLNSPMKNMEYKYNTKAFKNMKNLRFLQIDEVHLDGNFKHLPSKVLRCLRWNHCPLKYIPSGCSFENLVILEMRESNVEEFQIPLKYFRCLESLVLDCSEHLTRTPDFSGSKNLRRLSFFGCSSLVDVHSSIGELGMLVYLDLSCCKRLEKIPNSACELRSLEVLRMYNSSKIKELPENLGNLTSLLRLYLGGTNICSLPSNLSCQNDFKFFPNLEEISLDFCRNLEVLPRLPPSLQIISLAGCVNLKMLTELPPNLLEISFNGCKTIKELPNLSGLKSLVRLDLEACTLLEMLPELPQNLQSLYAKNCESLEKVHLSKMLEVLDLTCCRKLAEIQGWENVQFLRQMKLGGVPHIKFSENIKQVLIHHWWDFEYTLPDNEIPSWITSKKEGSSISFSLPLSNLEFLRLCVWVVLNPALRLSLHRQYHVTIENDGFKVDSRSCWIELLVGEEISFLHPITRDDLISRGIQEVGEIIEVTSKIEHFGECMVKKIGIEALYRGRDGLQFVPIAKVGLNTMKRKRHF